MHTLFIRRVMVNLVVSLMGLCLVSSAFAIGAGTWTCPQVKQLKDIAPLRSSFMLYGALNGPDNVSVNSVGPIRGQYFGAGSFVSASFISGGALACEYKVDTNQGTSKALVITGDQVFVNSSGLTCLMNGKDAPTSCVSSNTSDCQMVCAKDPG